MREWWSKLRAMLCGGKSPTEDVHDEIETHLAMEIEENVARGMPEDEARQAARRDFGNPTLIQERVHDAWTFTSLENLAKDLMHAARGAYKNPGFALTVVLALALGIDGITAMFTLIRTMLSRPHLQSDPILRSRHSQLTRRGAGCVIDRPARGCDVDAGGLCSRAQCFGGF